MILENDDGTPMNLTGIAVYSQFRKSYNSTVGYSFTSTMVDALNYRMTYLERDVAWVDNVEVK